MVHKYLILALHGIYNSTQIDSNSVSGRTVYQRKPGIFVFIWIFMENDPTSVKAHCMVKCPISNIENGCIVIFVILTSSTSDRSAQKWVYFI